MAKVLRNGLVISGSTATNVVTLTEAEYKALGEKTKTDNVLYAIKDLDEKGGGGVNITPITEEEFDAETEDGIYFVEDDYEEPEFADFTKAGFVQLSDDAGIPKESTSGLALPASEKNPNVAGSLAQQISTLETRVKDYLTFTFETGSLQTILDDVLNFDNIPYINRDVHFSIYLNNPFNIYEIDSMRWNGDWIVGTVICGASVNSDKSMYTFYRNYTAGDRTSVIELVKKETPNIIPLSPRPGTTLGEVDNCNYVKIGNICIVNFANVSKEDEGTGIGMILVDGLPRALMRTNITIRTGDIIYMDANAGYILTTGPFVGQYFTFIYLCE